MNEAHHDNKILHIILIVATLSLLVGCIGLFTRQFLNPEQQGVTSTVAPGGAVPIDSAQMQVDSPRADTGAQMPNGQDSKR